MDKALSYVSLARKARRMEVGEEPVGAAAKAQQAWLVVVAQDASDHTWRRANNFVAGTDQQCIRLDFSKDALGMAVGRTSLAMAAFTDPALALAFVKSLADPVRYGEVAEKLEASIRLLQRHKTKTQVYPRKKRQERVKKEH